MKTRSLLLAVAMLFVLISSALPTSVSAAPNDAVRKSGWAFWYRPKLMERVSKNRNLPIVSCMIASPYYKIGTWLRVTSKHGSKDCRVTDVPHPRDWNRIALVKGVVVELDFTSALTLCKRDPWNSKVPRNCRVTTTFLRAPPKAA